MKATGLQFRTNARTHGVLRVLFSPPTMKKLILALSLVLVAPAARAQVGVAIEVGLPVQPTVVEVEPGVRIVEGVDEEVFYSGGWYWCRRGDGWYRARSPRAHFFWVDRHRVPGPLARMPEGRYRNWRRADHPDWHGPRGHERPGFRHEGPEHDRGHEGHVMRGHDGGPAVAHPGPSRPAIHPGPSHPEHR